MHTWKKEENTNKEKNTNQENITPNSPDGNVSDEKLEEQDQNASVDVEEKKEASPEEKVIELEDKLARTFAEMENQRRRFEKEKETMRLIMVAFYLQKEALNLIDNLARSKLILESDETLKDSEALKKILEHLDIIN